MHDNKSMPDEVGVADGYVDPAKNAEEDAGDLLVTGGNLVEVTPLLPTLLNEAPLILLPLYALELGVSAALFVRQVGYWTKKSPLKHDGRTVVRFSYSGWQRQFPFLTRNWLMELIRRLEKEDVIRVYRSKGVNRIAYGDYKFKADKVDVQCDAQDKYIAHMLVFATLAKEVGLTEAIVLQQIHVRLHGHKSEYWVQKSFEEWGDVPSIVEG